MDIRQIWCVYWSATGNSKKVAEVISKELAQLLDCPLKWRDFTLPEARQSPMVFQEGELVVFALPTYAGKMPNKILPYLQTGLAGNGAWALAVTTFGNRSFDNALAELCGTLESNGFHTVAAGAFVGRHAFTDRLAPGRPNENDMAEIRQFARQAAQKVAKADTAPAPISVPGDSAAPYYVPKGIDGKPAKFLKAKPKTDRSRCISCGVCAQLCPMGSIDPRDVAEVPGTCIKCQRCIRVCPEGAKYFDDAAFLSHRTMLEQNFTTPKENHIFV